MGFAGELTEKYYGTLWKVAVLSYNADERETMQLNILKRLEESKPSKWH